MPPASAEDTHNGVPADVTGWGAGTCAAPQASLMEVAGKLGVADLLKPVQGYFEDTLHQTKNWVGMIALLHLDGDWYSSTKVILENLYDRVYDGGVLQIDDYGHWDGCRKAVHEFFSARNLTPIMTQIDGTGVWLEKPERFRINPQLSRHLVDEFQREDVLRMGLESQMSENERFQLYWTLRTQVQPTVGQSRLNFIEVGSFAGASLLQSYLALQWFRMPLKMYAVEPGGKAQFYEVLHEIKDSVSHLKMFSDAAAPILAQELAKSGCLADAIFIDGDHSYAGVKKDIERYFPLLKVGGVVLFHDYLPPLDDRNRAFILNHHANTEPGIRQACDEYFNGNPNAEPIELPLLKPEDPTQTQAWAPIIPGVFSTVRAWRRIR
jgi:predicted O-methyltransferase YrrM